MKKLIDICVKLRIEIDEDNPPIPNLNDLCFNRAHMTTSFPLNTKEGRIIKAKIWKADTLEVKDIS